MSIRHYAPDRTRNVVLSAAYLAMFAGTLVLLGWALDIALLKSISPDWVSMKANTAACFALLGFALWSRIQVAERSLLLARIVSLLVALIGLFTLLEYLLVWNAGIDQALFNEAMGTVVTSSPGRMAPDTALSFLLLGFALTVNSNAHKGKISLLAAAAVSIFVATFALAALLSYLTSALGSHGWFGYTVMAMHTAWLFLVLGVVITWLNWQKSAVHWSFSNHVTVAIFCGLVWLTLAGLNTGRSQLWLKANNQKVTDSEMLIGDLQNIMIAAIDAQAHARGYLITGEASFRDNFLSAKAESEKNFAALGQLGKATPLEEQQVKLIEKQVVFNLQRLQHVLETPPVSADARNRVTLQGEALLDELRVTLSQIENEHKLYLLKLKTQADEVAHFSNLFVLIGTLSSLLIFMIALARLNISKDKNLRMTNLYAALSQCNQAIVRCSNSEELFPQICRAAVTFGGMKMAWIGLLDEAGKQVRPVASFGEGTEYLDDKVITIDADEPWGRGPTGTAMRKNEPYWCQDFQHDPATLPWRERAAFFGWGASAALPLQCNGVVVGTFTLYSAHTGAFDEAARNLLVEMEMEISFALDSFAAREVHQTMELALSASEQQLNAIFNGTTDGIVLADAESRLFIKGNLSFCSMLGYTFEELTRVGVMDIHPELDLPYVIEQFERQSRGEITLAADMPVQRKDGSVFYADINATLVNVAGKSCMVGVFRDITERQQNEARIKYMANFDLLTGLPNRALLNERARYAISLAQRSDEHLSLMFLDLDRFKYINDSLGHDVGDELLLQVAARLKFAVRDEDTVSRLGGDEFILLVPGSDSQGAANVAKKLLAMFVQPYQVGLHEIVITPSIGIAMYPDDGKDFDELSKLADIAMYRAKQAGRNDFCFYTQEMQTDAARAILLSNALRHALPLGQLQLHYQPQVSLKDGHIIGAEALLRWQHPELGRISPAEFIPVAEDSGQIIAIGEWVMRTAVQQLKRWMDDGMAPMVMAVNLSALQFRHTNLPAMVTDILEESGLAPQYLELELTEGVAMDAPELAIATMNDLHQRGVRMSIDDFGTGYSSLSYLKRFQVYKLKIDQSFVRDISSASEDKAIVSAIISMACSLGMQTIAEGVETAEQLTFLRLQGCDEVQGYYFSEPLPAAQFEVYVKSKSL